MPGFDGTGPRGEGPMTGGGRGFCNPYRFPRGPFYRGFYGAGRGGIPWGGGRGRVWGGGRGWGGRGWGRGYRRPTPYYGDAEYYGGEPSYYGPQRPNIDDERHYLNDTLAALEEEVQEIKERLKALDVEEKKK